MDQRHLAIAEKYIDQLVQPDGTMSREWVLLQLARVAAEGEALQELQLDLSALSEWCKLDEGHQVVREHINGRDYITLWPDGEVCSSDDTSIAGVYRAAADYLRDKDATDH